MAKGNKFWISDMESKHDSSQQLEHLAEKRYMNPRGQISVSIGCTTTRNRDQTRSVSGFANKRLSSYTAMNESEVSCQLSLSHFSISPPFFFSFFSPFVASYMCCFTGDLIFLRPISPGQIPVNAVG